MYFVLFNGVSTNELDLKVKKRPSIVSPKKNFNEYNIVGTNGKLFEDLGTYDDIEIEIEFNYICDPELWHHNCYKIKKFFLSQNQDSRLTLSDNLDFYYRVKKIDISDIEREVRESGAFTVTFTCDPYSYSQEGLKEFEPDNLPQNVYDASYPIYSIKGEGVCNLTVNGVSCRCNVGQNLIINTFLKMSYRENGILQNTSINADYDDLILIEGYNSITISEGFELKIIPNWRRI